MGRKNRSKNSPSSSSVPTTVTDASPVPPEVKMAIDEEINQSFRAYNLGHHDKAIELMDKACQMHKTYLVPYITRSQLYNSLAKFATDPSQTHQLLQTATASAARAASSSPFNVYYRAHEATYLYQSAFFEDAAVYDQVIDLCDTALSLPTINLIDPAKDFSYDTDMLRLITSESRIQNSLRVLRYVRDNAICAKKRFPDIAKAASTLPKSLSIKDHRQNDEGNRKLPSSSYSKMRQRRDINQPLRTSISDEPKTKALNYLKSLSIEDRRALHLYSVRVMDLREFAKRQKLDALSSEALSVTAGGHPIKAFPCFFCNVVPFATAGEYMGHISESHVGDLGQQLKAAMPQKTKNQLEAVLPLKASSNWIQSFNWSPSDIPLPQSRDANNAERAELLAKIKKMFEMLVDKKILSVRHLHFVINWSKLRIPDQCTTELQNTGVAGTIECIRFLLARHLNILLKFLEELLFSSGFYVNNVADNSADTNAVQETRETPWLFLDQNWLILDLGEDDPDALIDWLYADLTDEDDHRGVWRTVLSDSRQLIEMLQKEFSFLYLLCLEKLRCLDAFAKLEELLSGKNASEEQLEKSREELLDGSNIAELVAISEIIPSSEIERDEVNTLLRRKGFGLIIQICRIDARILSSQRTLDQLEQRIEKASLYDYQIALMQLVKSFLQMRLEDQMYEDAKDKSDAFMKELVGEETIGVQIKNGGEHSKQGKRNSKGKKKQRGS